MSFRRKDPWSHIPPDLLQAALILFGALCACGFVFACIIAYGKIF